MVLPLDLAGVVPAPLGHPLPRRRGGADHRGHAFPQGRAHHRGCWHLPGSRALHRQAGGQAHPCDGVEHRPAGPQPLSSQLGSTENPVNSDVAWAMAAPGADGVDRGAPRWRIWTRSADGGGRSPQALRGVWRRSKQKRLRRECRRPCSSRGSVGKAARRSRTFGFAVEGWVWKMGRSGGGGRWPCRSRFG